MSKGEILYAKGMNLSESENEEEEDVWDDRKINEAYDKAMKIAGAEVAKRLAMSTNTSNKEVSESKLKKPPKASKSSGSQKSKSKPWKAGKPCRAVYEGDGTEYEAIILRIINNEECVVRFLGYDNSEIVPLNSLKPSLGETEQSRQLEEAQNYELSDPRDENDVKMNCSTEQPNSSGSTEQSYCSKKKNLTRKKHHTNKSTHMLNFPEMPPMPNMSMLKNMSSFEMPMPPPPPVALSDRSESEEQAISSMLLSWYMSGYYTGLYQGMKRANENRRH